MIARQILFLFSALGAINGILLAVYFFTRRPRSLADCMLGALLVAVGVRTAKSTFLFFNPELPLAYRQLGLSACLLIGPLTWLYVRYSLDRLAQRTSGGEWRWHLGLSCLIIGLGFFYRYSPFQIWYGIHLYWFCYLAAAGWALWKARHELFEARRRSSAGNLLLLSVYGGSFLILAAYVSTPFTSYIVGALSFTFSLHVGVMVFLLRRESGAQEKYRNSKLANEDALALAASLEQLMVGQKLHLNPNLTLAQLAKKAGATQAHLSQVLNDRLGKSFNAYVNEFRIADAKRLLTEEPQLNLEIVAERCGFNSSSTFFAAFKKAAGQTPASFRAEFAA
ncbi:helix-turn-helix transcriptional regulator [Massilia endophytica]|uniref:helix-turn-helix transcriptional regulator n=1 Tax=Massilia endophytica TaxID=2899220 RepID=UPI001E586563|nr:helix-turn-helix transcriptional regulator [Massilia endophytica]UGQ46275.1 helix-turn-helix transcriptional regulator [Massilia endophytica]